MGYAQRHDHVDINMDVQNLLNHKPEVGFLAGLFSDKVHSLEADNPWLSNAPSANDDAYDLASIDEFINQFHRAEYSLGHALDEPKKFEEENLRRSCNVIDLSDHHNFQYSLRETALEQDSAHLSGNNIDANVVTNIGRLKNGIQDPDAEGQKKRAKDADDARFAQRMMQEELILAEIEAQIEALRIEIEELNIEIQELQDAQAAAEGDLDGNDAASSARRRKVETALSKQGLSLDDFRGANGKVDNDRLRDALQRREDEARVEREERQQKLDELEQRHLSIQEEKVNRRVLATAGQSIQSNDFLDINERSIENQEEVTQLAHSNDLWDLLPEVDDNTPENRTPNNTIGSFAATEEERNVITPAFAAAIAADDPARIPEMEKTPTAEQTQYARQENRSIYGYG